jgi:polysaccharide export outer membrane protein
MAPEAEGAPYVIGIADVLEIRVWQHDDLQIEAPVRSDGKISVPLLDDVQASGLTPEQLKNQITKQLSKYLKNPDVTVTVVSADSQMVTVIGGVTSSGRVPLSHRMGVLDAVAAAGGFSAWANRGDVRIIRWEGDTKVSYRFNYRAYVKGDLNSDIVLRPGDVVVVPE